MTAPRDPLSGLDPYPREVLDTLWLHQERADLLEDIVSTPGPARSTTTRTRALLAAGIAAAVVIIGGGWLLAANDHDGSGGKAPVAAASASTTPASTASASASAGGTPVSTTAPAGSAGSAGSGRCRRLVARDHQLRRLLPLLRRGVAGKHHRAGRYYVRIARHGSRAVLVVGPDCTIRSLRSIETRH